jgi:hypothetical protein
MKNVSLALLSFLFMSFFLDPSPTMTCCYFESIAQGESIDRVVSCAGKPYCVKECNCGSLLYTYRVREEDPMVSSHSYAGDDNMFREAENYYLKVRNGVVVDKWCRDESESPWRAFDETLH